MEDTEDLKGDYWRHWVIFEGDDEKEEALNYLKSWKKFAIRKFQLEDYGDEHIVERIGIGDNKVNTLGIKFKIR